MPAATPSCVSCQAELPSDAIFCPACGTATPTGISTGATREAPGGSSTAVRLQQVLGTQYEVRTLIGRGGFADVYAVWDTRLKRELAVKVLRPELVLSDVILERFRREAEAVAALRHPGILPIFDVGEGNGLAYIIMPRVEGESLRARLERCHTATAEEVEMILLEAASALSVAHDAGMVHRDIKPENIMLEGKNARVLLMDFGIAKAVDAGQGELTQSGVIIGTPQYMSPEQAAGERAVDHRSDQYSLAVVGYRMLTGQLPFEADSIRTVLYRQLIEVAPPAHEVNPEIPVELSQVIARGMAKEPADRYPNMDTFAADLIRHRAGDSSGAVSGVQGLRAVAELTPVPEPVATVPTPTTVTPIPARSRTTRRRVGWMAGVGAIVVIITAAAITRTGGGAGVTRQTAVADSAAVVDTTMPNLAATVVDASPTTTPAPTPTCTRLFASLDWDRALTRCRSEAGAGVVRAQRTLGIMYELGHGTEVNPDSAGVWLGRAADAGDAEGAYRLAGLVDVGRGVPRDRERATALYQVAAEEGLLEGILALAQRYESGIGVKRDDSQAFTWYRRAADRGHIRAQAMMAVMYGRGQGVERDRGESVRWLRMAANGGDAEAQYQLGMAYLKGDGVGESEAEALNWFEKAGKQGHRDALDQLRRHGR